MVFYVETAVRIKTSLAMIGIFKACDPKDKLDGRLDGGRWLTDLQTGGGVATGQVGDESLDCEVLGALDNEG